MYLKFIKNIIEKISIPDRTAIQQYMKKILLGVGHLLNTRGWTIIKLSSANNILM